MKDIWDIKEEWDGLIDDVTAYYSFFPDEISEETEFDCNLFRDAMFDAYEYFKNIFDHSNIRGGRDPHFLSADESDLLATIYAYSRMEEFNGYLCADEYCLASQFAALGLYEEIFSLGLEDSSYEFVSEFKYVLPGKDGNSDSFEFKYNVKTGDLTEIVDLIRLFKKEGDWPNRKCIRVYSMPEVDFTQLVDELENNENGG